MVNGEKNMTTREEEAEKLGELLSKVPHGYGYIILEPNDKDPKAFQVKMVEKFKQTSNSLVVNHILRGVLWLLENDIEYILEVGEKDLMDEISEVRKKEYEGTNVLDFFSSTGKKKH